MPRVVIIGAGVVGCAARRRADRARLDRRHRRRPGAAVRHRRLQRRTRPGWCSRPTASKTMAELARYTVEKLRGAGLLPPGRRPGGGHHAASGWPNCTAGTAGPPPGAIEARGDRRRRTAPTLHPLLDPRAGARRAARAHRRPRQAPSPPSRRRPGAAQARGARFLGGHEVLDIRVDRRPGAPRSSPTRASSRPTSWCAAPASGARRWPRMVGMTLPLTPLAHQLAWTGPVPALAGQTARGDPPDPAPPGPRPVLPRALRPPRHRLVRPPPDADRRGRDRRRGRGRADAVGAAVHRGRLRPGLDRDPVAAARDAGGEGRRGHQRALLLHHRQHARCWASPRRSRASGSPRRCG